MNKLQEMCLWVGATRYYMERIPVSNFCELLIEKWPELSDETKRIIQGDIIIEMALDDKDREEGKEHKRLGNKRKDWEKVAELWGKK